MNITNTAEIFSDETLSTSLDSASTTFAIEEGTITMTKTTNKINEAYFPGEQITFTITITNNGTTSVTGLAFQDIIDASIGPLTGNTFNVTTTSGTIINNTNTILITNIELAPSQIVTITITGRVV